MKCALVYFTVITVLLSHQSHVIFFSSLLWKPIAVPQSKTHESVGVPLSQWPQKLSTNASASASSSWSKLPLHKVTIQVFLLVASAPDRQVSAITLWICLSPQISWGWFGLSHQFLICPGKTISPYFI